MGYEILTNGKKYVDSAYEYMQVFLDWKGYSMLKKSKCIEYYLFYSLILKVFISYKSLKKVGVK